MSANGSFAPQEQPLNRRFLNFHGQDSFFAVTGGWLYSASV